MTTWRANVKKYNELKEKNEKEELKQFEKDSDSNNSTNFALKPSKELAELEGELKDLKKYAGEVKTLTAKKDGEENVEMDSGSSSEKDKVEGGEEDATMKDCNAAVASSPGNPLKAYPPKIPKAQIDALRTSHLRILARIAVSAKRIEQKLATLFDTEGNQSLKEHPQYTQEAEEFKKRFEIVQTELDVHNMEAQKKFLDELKEVRAKILIDVSNTDPNSQLERLTDILSNGENNYFSKLRDPSNPTTVTDSEGEMSDDKLVELHSNCFSCLSDASRIVSDLRKTMLLPNLDSPPKESHTGIASTSMSEFFKKIESYLKLLEEEEELEKWKAWEEGNKKEKKSSSSEEGGNKGEGGERSKSDGGEKDDEERLDVSPETKKLKKDPDAGKDDDGDEDMDKEGDEEENLSGEKSTKSIKSPVKKKTNPYAQTLRKNYNSQIPRLTRNRPEIEVHVFEVSSLKMPATAEPGSDFTERFRALATEELTEKHVLLTESLVVEERKLFQFMQSLRKSLFDSKMKVRQNKYRLENAIKQQKHEEERRKIKQIGIKGLELVMVCEADMERYFEGKINPDPNDKSDSDTVRFGEKLRSGYTSADLQGLLTRFQGYEKELEVNLVKKLEEIINPNNPSAMSKGRDGNGRSDNNSNSQTAGQVKHWLTRQYCFRLKHMTRILENWLQKDVQKKNHDKLLAQISISWKIQEFMKKKGYYVEPVVEKKESEAPKESDTEAKSDGKESEEKKEGEEATKPNDDSKEKEADGDVKMTEEKKESSNKQILLQQAMSKLYTEHGVADMNYDDFYRFLMGGASCTKEELELALEGMWARATREVPGSAAASAKEAAAEKKLAESEKAASKESDSSGGSTTATGSVPRLSGVAACKERRLTENQFQLSIASCYLVAGCAGHLYTPCDSDVLTAVYFTDEIFNVLSPVETHILKKDSEDPKIKQEYEQLERDIHAARGLSLSNANKVSESGTISNFRGQNPLSRFEGLMKPSEYEGNEIKVQRVKVLRTLDGTSECYINLKFPELESNTVNVNAGNAAGPSVKFRPFDPIFKVKQETVLTNIPGLRDANGVTHKPIRRVKLNELVLLTEVPKLDTDSNLTRVRVQGHNSVVGWVTVRGNNQNAPSLYIRPLCENDSEFKDFNSSDNLNLSTTDSTDILDTTHIKDVLTKICEERKSDLEEKTETMGKKIKKFEELLGQVDSLAKRAKLNKQFKELEKYRAALANFNGSGTQRSTLMNNRRKVNNFVAVRKVPSIVTAKSSKTYEVEESSNGKEPSNAKKDDICDDPALQALVEQEEKEAAALEAEGEGGDSGTTGGDKDLKDKEKSNVEDAKEGSGFTLTAAEPAGSKQGAGESGDIAAGNEETKKSGEKDDEEEDSEPIPADAGPPVLDPSEITTLLKDIETEYLTPLGKEITEIYRTFARKLQDFRDTVETGRFCVGHIMYEKMMAEGRGDSNSEFMTEEWKTAKHISVQDEKLYNSLRNSDALSPLQHLKLLLDVKLKTRLETYQTKLGSYRSPEYRETCALLTLLRDKLLLDKEIADSTKLLSSSSTEESPDAPMADSDDPAAAAAAESASTALKTPELIEVDESCKKILEQLSELEETSMIVGVQTNADNPPSGNNGQDMDVDSPSDGSQNNVNSLDFTDSCIYESAKTSQVNVLSEELRAMNLQTAYDLVKGDMETVKELRAEFEKSAMAKVEKVEENLIGGAGTTSDKKELNLLGELYRKMYPSHVFGFTGLAPLSNSSSSTSVLTSMPVFVQFPSYKSLIDSKLKPVLEEVKEQRKRNVAVCARLEKAELVLKKAEDGLVRKQRDLIQKFFNEKFGEKVGEEGFGENMGELEEEEKKMESGEGDGEGNDDGGDDDVKMGSEGGGEKTPGAAAESDEKKDDAVDVDGKKEDEKKDEDMEKNPQEAESGGENKESDEKKDDEKKEEEPKVEAETKSPKKPLSSPAKKVPKKPVNLDKFTEMLRTEIATLREMSQEYFDKAKSNEDDKCLDGLSAEERKLRRKYRDLYLKEENFSAHLTESFLDLEDSENNGNAHCSQFTTNNSSTASDSSPKTQSQTINSSYFYLATEAIHKYFLKSSADSDSSSSSSSAIQNQFDLNLLEQMCFNIGGNRKRILATDFEYFICQRLMRVVAPTCRLRKDKNETTNNGGLRPIPTAGSNFASVTPTFLPRNEIVRFLKIAESSTGVPGTVVKRGLIARRGDQHSSTNYYWVNMTDERRHPAFVPYETPFHRIFFTNSNNNSHRTMRLESLVTNQVARKVDYQGLSTGPKKPSSDSATVSGTNTASTTNLKRQTASENLVEGDYVRFLDPPYRCEVSKKLKCKVVRILPDLVEVSKTSNTTVNAGSESVTNETSANNFLETVLLSYPSRIGRISLIDKVENHGNMWASDTTAPSQKDLLKQEKSRNQVRRVIPSMSFKGSNMMRNNNNFNDHKSANLFSVTNTPGQEHTPNNSYNNSGNSKGKGRQTYHNNRPNMGHSNNNMSRGPGNNNYNNRQVHKDNGKNHNNNNNMNNMMHNNMHSNNNFNNGGGGGAGFRNTYGGGGGGKNQYNRKGGHGGSGYHNSRSGNGGGGNFQQMNNGMM